MAVEMISDNIWFDKWRYDEAECQYFTKRFKNEETSGVGSLATKISKAREVIQNSLATGTPPSAVSSSSNTGNMHPDVLNRLTKLEGENSHLTKTVSSLEKMIVELTKRLATLECGKPVSTTATPLKVTQTQEKDDEDDDEDVDLFGSDDEEEDEEASRVREERLKAYAEKKAKKPGPIAKSSVLLDVKPWDDETDMVEMEKLVRTIQMDGLVWGAGKLVPLAFGIKKLSILCIVEDEKVSIDDLIEKIVEFEDIVQSVDIGAFNKI